MQQSPVRMWMLHLMPHVERMPRSLHVKNLATTLWGVLSYRWPVARNMPSFSSGSQNFPNLHPEWPLLKDLPIVLSDNFFWSGTFRTCMKYFPLDVKQPITNQLIQLVLWLTVFTKNKLLYGSVLDWVISSALIWILYTLLYMFCEIQGKGSQALVSVNGGLLSFSYTCG